MESMTRGQQIIGQTLSEKGTRLFSGRDPASGQALEPAFREATTDEIDGAAKLAAAAFVPYARLAPERRALFLEAVADAIQALGEPLIQTCTRETALPTARLEGERARTLGQLRLFASVVREGSWVEARIDPAIPDRQPLPRPDVRRMLFPLGPVAVFGASNFPLAFSVAGGDTASALAAGCPVIFKAHPAHPATSQLVGTAVMRAARETGMPEGVFSLLHGPSPDTGRALVRHPAVAAVAFTGSFRGGKAIFDEAARRPTPIPVYAEMGSTNPVFLLPGALEERAEKIAEGLANSILLGVGQFCTNPGTFFTLASDPARSFLQLISSVMGRKSGGVMLTLDLKKAFESGIARLRAIEGVRVLAAGSPASGDCAVGPVVLAADAATVRAHPELMEEVFGPSSVAVTADTREQLMEMARSLGGHLTATIHGTEDDLREFTDLVEVLRQKAGRLIFNGFPTGVEVCHAMHHGGPYPATTDSRSTSVGTAAIQRFARPVCFQDFPDFALPPELQNSNPAKLWRLVDGQLTRGEQAAGR